MESAGRVIENSKIKTQNLLWRLLISIVLSSRSLLTLISLFLEFGLDLLHSFFFLLLDVLFSNPKSSTRAWWDNRKGSAIVIYCPSLEGQQAAAVSTAIALRLASLDPTQPQPLSLTSPTSFFSRLPFSSSKTFHSSGSPPYTCLVVLPNEHSITPLMGAWAEKKAQLQRAREAKLNKKANSPFSIFRDMWDEKEELLADRETEGELNDTSNWEASSNFSYEEVTPRASPDGTPQELPTTPLTFNRGRSSSSASNRRGNSSQSANESVIPVQKSGPKKRSRRKSISWGSWTASDIVGFGRDMVKGLKIGKSGRKGMGSVIPVIANLNQSPEALTVARSTIQAYCSGHDLLLRGLIVVPSILSPKTNETVPQSLGIQTLPSWDTQLNSDDAIGSGYSSVPVAPPPISRRRSGSHLRPLTSSNLAGASAERYSNASNRESPPAPSSQTSNPHLNSPPLSPRSSFYHLNSIKRNHLLDQSLRIDVSETLGLVETLFPTLKRDGGRIVALVPSGWGESVLRTPKDGHQAPGQAGLSFGNSGGNVEQTRGRSPALDVKGSSIGLYESTPSPPPFASNDPTEGMIFSAVRESIKIMWKEKRRDLEREGVKISLILTSPIQAPLSAHGTDLPPCLQAKKTVLESRARSPNLKEISHKKIQSPTPKNSFAWSPNSPHKLSNFRSLSNLVHDTLETLYFVSNPASHLLDPPKPSKSKSSKSKSGAHLWQKPSTSFDRAESRRSNEEENETEAEFVPSFKDRSSLKMKEKVSDRNESEVDQEEKEREAVSPLVESILSSLSRSRPRSRYVNGLGPRIEELFQEVFGARYIREALAAWLRE